MNKSVEEILNTIKESLLKMILEEDCFNFCPPIRTFLDMDIEKDIYKLMKLANSEEQARDYLKKVIDLAGDFYEFPPIINGEYYPEYYIDYFKKLRKEFFHD